MNHNQFIYQEVTKFRLFPNKRPNNFRNSKLSQCPRPTTRGLRNVQSLKCPKHSHNHLISHRKIPIYLKCKTIISGKDNSTQKMFRRQHTNPL